MKVLPGKRRNVRIHVIGRPVGNPCAHGNRLEAVAEGRDVRRNVAALAPAHRAQAVFVHEPFRDQRIHARNHVRIIANAQVPHIQRPEFLSVTCRAAIIWPHHHRAFGHKSLDGIVAVRIHDRLIHARRPAVNHHQQRVFFLGVEIRRRVKHAFNRRSVPRLPRSHFAVRQRKSFELLSHRRELLALPRSRAGRENLCVLIVERRTIRHPLVIPRKRKAPCHHAFRLAQPLHRSRPRIQTKQVHGGLLHRAKINPIRPPRNQPGVFVKRLGQNLHRSAVRAHHSNPSIGIKKVLRPGGRLKRNVLPVRRPVRISVRPRRAHDLFHGLVVYMNHVQVRCVPGNQIRIPLRAERDARPIRRPRKIPHAELVPFGQTLRFRGRRASVRKLNRPQVRHLVIAMHHRVFPILFFSVFHGLGFRIRHGNGHAFRVRRPGKIVYAVFHVRDLLRLPAVCGNHVQLLLGFRGSGNLSRPVGEKRDPSSIRRPLWIRTRFLCRSQRMRFAARDIADP